MLRAVARLAAMLRLPWLESLAGLILTRPCGLCDRPCAEGLCDRCRGQLLAQANPCWQSPLFSWGPYSGDLRRAIGRLKYDGQRPLADWLGNRLAEAVWNQGLLRGPAHPWLVPVPIHPDRFRQRGFNQAELLAAAIARRLDLMLATDVLRRVRRTLPQHGLSSRDRQENLQGAFAAVPGRRSPALWLVDDIFTTGATLNEARATLLAQGWTVETVLVVAIAERRTTGGTAASGPGR